MPLEMIVPECRGLESIDSIVRCENIKFLAYAPFGKLFGAEGGNAGACAGIVGRCEDLTSNNPCGGACELFENFEHFW